MRDTDTAASNFESAVCLGEIGRLHASVEDMGSTPPRARRITEQLDALRAALAKYRERAIAIHRRLVELESAGNDNVAELRQTLIASSIQIESVTRSLVDAPAVESNDWPDEPTLDLRR